MRRKIHIQNPDLWTADFFILPFCSLFTNSKEKKKNKKNRYSDSPYFWRIWSIPSPVIPSINRFIRFSLKTKTEELWISFHNSVFKFFIQIRSHSIVVPTCFIVRIICHFVRCRSVFLGLLWWNIFAFPVVLVRDMLEMVQ